MSQKTKKKSFGPGEIRNSQIITTYGPGSIFQSIDDSVIIAGLDAWPEAFELEQDVTKYKIIHNAFLEKICKKEHFRMPQIEDNVRAGIPVNSFPEWGYCPFKGCARLQRHKKSPTDSSGLFYCEDCKSKGFENKLIPARLIIMCNYGHIDEFPWVEWCHSQHHDQTSGICENPKLQFKSSARSFSLSSYYVSCECGKWRPMYGALNVLDTLPDIHSGTDKPFVCNGTRPWLRKNAKCPPPSPKDSKTKKFTQPVRGMLVRASNIYFGSVINALQIPEFRHKIYQAIEENMQTIQNDIKDKRSLEEIASRESIFEKVSQEFSKEEIVEKLKNRLEPNVENELDIRDKEYNDLINTNFEGDDVIDISDVKVDNSLTQYIDKIKRVDRLTLIKVLRYFTRNQPPDPFARIDMNDTNICKAYHSQLIRWLPSVEHKGEGIFFSLNEKKLKDWENRVEVQERCKPILQGYFDFASEKNWQARKIGPRYLLQHTLSHALIRHLSFVSGYNEASIAERIYSGENHNAILLYTSAGASDGSLGGLVRQSENFSSLLSGSIEKSRSCSRDPLCVEDDIETKIELHEPSYHRFNGASCYACCLLPETSCEEFNRLLDRKLLFDKKIGYFGDYA